MDQALQRQMVTADGRTSFYHTTVGGRRLPINKNTKYLTSWVSCDLSSMDKKAQASMSQIRILVLLIICHSSFLAYCLALLYARYSGRTLGASPNVVRELYFSAKRQFSHTRGNTGGLYWQKKSLRGYSRCWRVAHQTWLQLKPRYVNISWCVQRCTHQIGVYRWDQRHWTSSLKTKVFISHNYEGQNLLCCALGTCSCLHCSGEPSCFPRSCFQKSSQEQRCPVVAMKSCPSSIDAYVRPSSDKALARFT